MQLTTRTAAPEPAGSPTITLMRRDEAGFVSPIDDAEARSNPEIRDTVANVRAFDGWLRSHGRNGWNDQGGDIKVAFVDGDPEAASFYTDRTRRGWISLGAPGERFVRSPGASAVIIGHELAHGIVPRAWATKEGLGDVMGHVFAQQLSLPGGTHWRMAAEVLRPELQATGLRDGAAPLLGSVDAVVGATLATGVFPVVHDLGGPVTQVASRLEHELGAARNSTVWAHAILHELDGTAARDAAVRGVAEIGERVLVPERPEHRLDEFQRGSLASYVGELRAVEAAVAAAIDATAPSAEQASVEHAAAKRAWNTIDPPRPR